MAASARGMGPERAAKFVKEICAGDMHAARAASLANAVTGALAAAALGVSAIGVGLAQARGTGDQARREAGGSAAEQQEAGRVGGVRMVGSARDRGAQGGDGVAGLDVVRGGRPGGGGAVDDDAPRSVDAAGVADGAGVGLKGNRNDIEDSVLKRLREVVPEDVKVTVLADRGFADCELFEFLGELGFDYVIRLRGNYQVTSAGGEKRKASDWVGAGGRARTLRDATVTDARRWRAATVACVKDRDMDEPWCLVSSERRSARAMVALYAKRWGIETSFRDVKNPRFGMGLTQTRVGRVDRRDRMLLVGAMAMALLTLLGAAGERIGYDRLLKSNTSKTRQHSLFRQGVMLHGHIPNWPDEKVRPLLEAFEDLILEQRIFREVFGII